MKITNRKTMTLLILVMSIAVMLCACNGRENETNPNTTGMATLNPTLTGGEGLPLITDSPSPVVSNSPLQTGTSTNEIPDFMEGTVVDPENVPEIVAAIEANYDETQIRSITHALHMDKQVYEVIFSDKDGISHTAYVSADGKTVTEAEPNTASPTVTNG